MMKGFYPHKMILIEIQPGNPRRLQQINKMLYQSNIAGNICETQNYWLIEETNDRTRAVVQRKNQQSFKYPVEFMLDVCSSIKAPSIECVVSSNA